MKTPEKAEIEDFILHASRAFFASAWADQIEENGQSFAPQTEIFSVMPGTVDPAALHAARTLYMDIERVNNASIFQLMAIVARDGDGDRPSTIEHFGHYAAMQAMGHGVGLFDAFGSEVHGAIKVPCVEFSSCSLEKEYQL